MNVFILCLGVLFSLISTIQIVQCQTSEDLIQSNDNIISPSPEQIAMQKYRQFRSQLPENFYTQIYPEATAKLSGLNGDWIQPPVQILDSAQIAAGATQYNISRPEGPRYFFVYVPEKYLQNPNQQVSLIFAYHGLNDYCGDFGPKVGFDKLADQHGFIYIYPCGESGFLGLGWNAGECCLLDHPVDDLAFTRLMIDFALANFNINKSEIFVSGFSNGAMMAETLACHYPDIFRAAASVSGTTQMVPGEMGGLTACTNVFNNFTTPQQISLLHIHGTFDFVVPWIGDPFLKFPAIPLDLTDWSERNRCSNQTIQTLNIGPFSNSIWETCSENVHIELVKWAGGGHRWPRTSQFNATNYIYNYFVATSQLNY